MVPVSVSLISRVDIGLRVVGFAINLWLISGIRNVGIRISIWIMIYFTSVAVMLLLVVQF